MTRSQPESVGFDPGKATDEAAEFIQANALQRGVLLVEPGQSLDLPGCTGRPLSLRSILAAGQGMPGVVLVHD